jgi:hypothetical protein
MARHSWAFVFALFAGLAACAGTPGGAALAVPSPMQWHGTWRGMLLEHADGRAKELVPMELLVGPSEMSSAVQWRITYGDGDTDVRDYSLVEIDAATGRYVVDEPDDVVLVARLCGEALISVFEVQGVTLVARYVWRGDHIDFELESVAASAARSTGKGVRYWDKPKVQRARLWRAQ